MTRWRRQDRHQFDIWEIHFHASGVVSWHSRGKLRIFATVGRELQHLSGGLAPAAQLARNDNVFVGCLWSLSPTMKNSRNVRVGISITRTYDIGAPNFLNVRSAHSKCYRGILMWHEHGGERRLETGAMARPVSWDEAVRSPAAY